MWCAHCGEALEQLPHGGYRAHVGTEAQRGCISRDYWLETGPLPRDNLLPPERLFHKGRWFWLYRGTR